MKMFCINKFFKYLNMFLLFAIYLRAIKDARQDEYKDFENTRIVKKIIYFFDELKLIDLVKNLNSYLIIQ